MPPPLPAQETAETIIEDALEVAGITGIGVTPGPEDVNRAFRRLNDMLAQWQQLRWLIWHLVNQVVTSTGQQTYTVGNGQQFNFAVAPRRIESAFLRMITQAPPNQVDVSLDILPSREDYDLIRLKQLGTFSSVVWYDSQFPVGLLYPWPIPQASIYGIGITVKEVLNQFSSVVSPVTIPPEYVPAMKWNLAQRIRIAYRRPADPDLNKMAAQSLNVIRLANAQVPNLRMPRQLRRGTGVYNPYADRVT